MRFQPYERGLLRALALAIRHHGRHCRVSQDQQLFGLAVQDQSVLICHREEYRVLQEVLQ